MKKVKARYNSGRWIWDCPVCPAANLVAPGDDLVYCGGCYPDKLRAEKEKAKRKAWGNDEVYKVKVPDNHAEIEETLKERIKGDRDWEVGETIANLKKENRTHPVLGYLRDRKKAKKDKKKLPKDILERIK